MKKFLYIICAIVPFFLFSINAQAIDYVNNVFRLSMNGIEKINNEQEITIDLDLKVSYNLSSIIGDMVYDKTKLELIGCESEYFTCTYTDKVLLDSVEGITGSKKVAKLIFKVLSGFNPGEDTIIEFKNVAGDNNTVGNNSKIKIHKLQNDTSLSSLTIDGENLIPEFSSDITTYKIETCNNTININATSNSIVSGTGFKELSLGNNIFEIKVKSETNEERIYIINAFRKEQSNDDPEKKENVSSTENNSVVNNGKKIKNKDTNKDSDTKELSSNKKILFLNIIGTNFKFNENLFEYTIKLESDPKDVKVDYKLEDAKSKLVISGDTTYSKKENNIVISVIAEDGSQIDYKIKIINDNYDKADEKNVEKDKEIIEENKKGNTTISIIIIIIVLVIVAIFIYINKFKKTTIVKL